MRFSALSVTAICAILASASPVEKREPQQSDGFNVISASHSGLGKRFSLLSAGSVVINGQTIAPGSQPFPHVFVAGPGQPVCNIYCLNPAITTPDLVKSCQDRGCPISSTVNPNAFYVLNDDTTIYKGDRLHGCPTGGICVDAQTTALDIGPALPATT